MNLLLWGRNLWIFLLFQCFLLRLLSNRTNGFCCRCVKIINANTWSLRKARLTCQLHISNFGQLISHIKLTEVIYFVEKETTPKNNISQRLISYTWLSFCCCFHFNHLLLLLKSFPGESLGVCPQLNVSKCEVTEFLPRDGIIAVLYNPLAFPVTSFLRLPLQQPGVSVQDAHGNPVNSSINLLSNSVFNLFERHSSSRWVVQ